ncbi:MAG TPA: glutamate formimidoyltransferase [Bacteroidetes bacterium]|nr:glutamate formimidoyltransferase [Bacteroidota bacterium]
MEKLIECVPNFSEGLDMGIIDRITGEMEQVEGVKLLNVDPGKATNRTVVTFAGSPEGVVEAAFQAIKKAKELIDMSKHHGEHPRMGATDVCPLVPIANISMEETVEYARRLAERVGKELGIPVYCYEEAAFEEKRRNLASIRAGEYEGLKDKLTDPAWKPDFGPAEFLPRSGATVIGARDFLVAYNINLNTTSTRRANAIAFDVREKGRVKREGGSLTGKIIRNEQGNPVMIPGTLKAVKAIGWYIEEYGIAQISMNLTNISITPIHVAFEEVCKKADARGVRVTGSEIVGLVPLKALLDAGKYFLRKQKRSLGLPEKEIIKIAVKSLGLDDLYPFKPEEKIIEYVLNPPSGKRLVDMSVEDFADETSSESPAPGGGSVSACMGALGAALGTMVANLSSHKRGWDDRWEEFSDWAVKGKQYQEKLIRLVDEDTAAFDSLMEAYGLPKKTDEEKAERERAVQNATKKAMQVPLKVMETALDAMEVCRAMAKAGNPNSISDAGVGALALRAGIRGAFLNVRINASGCIDEDFVKECLQKGREIDNRAENTEREILAAVEKNMEK